MCELFAMSSEAPTNINFSLNIFAQHGGGSSRAIDGWGLAFYDGNDVRLYKEPEPAGQSDWLSFIEQRTQLSELVLSHIRHATRGAISLGNTQPFLRELGGRVHAFAHNGNLPEIEQRMEGRWQRFQPIGQTDSEIAFCILLQSLSLLWTDRRLPSVEDRMSIISSVAAEFREIGPANFIYSDGDMLFAHGHRRIQHEGAIAPPGLFSLKRTCHIADQTTSASGVRIEAGALLQELMLFASVPLTDEPWQPFFEGELIAVRHGRRISMP
jgi:glutamine amidotransferase